MTDDEWSAYTSAFVPPTADLTDLEKIAFCHECRGRCDSCIRTVEGYKQAEVSP